MKIMNLWVATAKYSQLHQIYKLLLDKDEREQFAGLINIDSETKKLEKKKSSIQARSPFKLIEGEEYYVNNKEDEISEANLVSLFNNVINNLEELKDSVVVTFKKHKRQYEEKEIERFYIILTESENEKQLHFIYINSRNIVRKKRFLDYDLRLSKSSAIIDVSNAIPIPSHITASYSYKTAKLYVHDVFSFERMLFLNEAYKERANEQISEFKAGRNKVGEEEYKVKGLESDEVKHIIFSKVRHTRRLADFNQATSSYPINNIEVAVNRIPDKDEKVDFCHKSKEIRVNDKNIGTFVAIVHDSIVERIISGDVEVI